MKKIYFVLTVLATVVLSSCLKDPLEPMSNNELIPLGENDIAFVLGGTSTKALNSATVMETGLSIPMGTDPQGNKLYLQETIEHMNAAPGTKGTPAYTFNVGTLYTTMGVYAATGNFADDDETGEATFEVMDLYQHDKNDTSENPAKGWRYRHGYAFNPWPEEDTKVDFFLRMPASPTGLSELSYPDNEKISFEFNSPTNGANQQDILFGHTSISHNDHDGYLPYGAPVDMTHALTGVKFRNGHANDGATKTIITQVKFKNLRSYGVCTFTPDAEEGTNNVEWEGLDNMTTFTMDFSSLNPTYVPSAGTDNPDGTISYGSDSQYAGTSWASAASDHNINDEDGSFTFWFIPQQIDESVKLEVTFLVKTPDTPDGTEVTHIIDFGQLVTQTTGEGEDQVTTYTEWKAGELRTYTLKPFDVDVEIFDEMSDLTKDNLHVTNTGNVDEYVRVMVIGNWYGWKSQADKDAGKEPMILVGYENADPNNDTMVRPWYREDSVYGQGFDSTFPMGRPANGRTDWVRGTGGYFYYTSVIGAGQQLSGTNALFQHYELQERMIPTIYLPVANQTTRQAAVGVHLVMEIVVQAVPTTVDGEEVNCWDAWSYAVGKEIKAK